MSPFEIPENTRDYSIGKEAVLSSSLRNLAPQLILGLLSLFVCGLCIIPDCLEVWFGYGTLNLLENLVFWTFPPLIVLYWLQVITNFRKALRQRVLGIPLRLGFDEKGLYTSSPYTESFRRWNGFSAWKEHPRSFLLQNSGTWLIVPKNILSEKEAERLQGYLRSAVAARDRG